MVLIIYEPVNNSYIECENRRWLQKNACLLFDLMSRAHPGIAIAGMSFPAVGAATMYCTFFDWKQ
jgi:hypothetical protein